MDNRLHNEVPLSPGEQAVVTIRNALQDENAYKAPGYQIYNLNLGDHTTESLATAIISFVSLRSRMDADQMVSVINLATELHAPDLRHGSKDGPQAYIIHPLRNTLRLIRLGATDVSLLKASVLHDTVEDHPFELAVKAGTTTEDEQKAREAALGFLSETYGSETARIVEGMSNPVTTDKNMTRDQFVEIYLDHVKTATIDPTVFACKLSDLIDNAVGLENETRLEPARHLRMAKKYYPTIEIMMARLDTGERQGDLPLSSQGIKDARALLQSGYVKLGKALQSK